MQSYFTQSKRLHFPTCFDNNGTENEANRQSRQTERRKVWIHRGRKNRLVLNVQQIKQILWTISNLNQILIQNKNNIIIGYCWGTRYLI